MHIPPSQVLHPWGVKKGGHSHIHAANCTDTTLPEAFIRSALFEVRGPSCHCRAAWEGIVLERYFNMPQGHKPTDVCLRDLLVVQTDCNASDANTSEQCPCCTITDGAVTQMKLTERSAIKPPANKHHTTKRNTFLNSKCMRTML